MRRKSRIAVLEPAFRSGKVGTIRVALRRLEKLGLYQRKVFRGVTTWTPTRNRVAP